MGAESDLSARSTDANNEGHAVVFAVQNPGPAEGGQGPPPMLAIPVEAECRAEGETGRPIALASAAAPAPTDEPVILHVRCSGCSLVVQFPLIPDVRRHGIICSVCARARAGATLPRARAGASTRVAERRRRELA